MPVDFTIIGKRVKEIRLSKNLSQAKLAEMADLSTQYLSHIETARKQASLTSLISIAKEMDITLDELLNGNQINSPVEYKNDIDILLSDCTKYEKRVLFELMRATKRILRENESLLEYSDED